MNFTRDTASFEQHRTHKGEAAESVLRERGEARFPRSSRSPPINQYTLRFPIVLERFISSIPHRRGAVIFACTGCALSQSAYKYSGAIAGRVTGRENERPTFLLDEGSNGIIPPQQGRWEWSPSVYKRD